VHRFLSNELGYAPPAHRRFLAVAELLTLGPSDPADLGSRFTQLYVHMAVDDLSIEIGAFKSAISAD
jgi:hypothetical protein